MLDLNVSPFYDDYNEDKNFHKILFVPGNPVQARELTQLQTILQNQVKRNADHMFKNGTMVIPGNVYYDSKIKYIKIEQFYGGIYADSILDDQVGIKFLGDASGVEAQVILVAKSENSDPATIFIRYTAANGDAKEFAQGEVITGSNGIQFQIQNIADYTGFGSTCAIAEGIYYVNGFFVRVDQQTVIIDKYTNQASAKVGLTIIDSIVTANEDETLFDNAMGFSNYAAPGAHRYKIELTLEVKDYDYADVSSGDISFIEILQIKNGAVQKLINETKYAEIEKMLAQRTYDESGDYVVSPFTVQAKEYRSNNRGSWVQNRAYLIGDIVTNDGKFYYARSEGISGATAPTHSSGVSSDGSIFWAQVSSPIYNTGLIYATEDETIAQQKANLDKVMYDISSGSAYVRGFQVTKQTNTLLEAPKAIDYIDVNNGQIFPNIGSYVEVNTLIGIPANGTTIIPSVDVKDSLGATIGTAWVRNIEYVDGTVGTANAKYKVHIIGLKMNADKDFSIQAFALSGANFSANLVQKSMELVGVSTTTNGSATVTGKGTNYDEILAPGARITVGTETRIVNELDSVLPDTQFTVTSAFTETNAEKKMFLNYVDILGSGIWLSRMPIQGVRSIRDINGNIDTQYVIAKRFAFSTGAQTTAQITLSVSGETFEPIGHIVSDITNSDAIVAASYSLNTGSTILTISGLSISSSYELWGLVRRTGASAAEKIKTLNTKTVYVKESGVYDSSNTLISASWDISKRAISLTEADVISISKITMTGGTDPSVYEPTGEVDLTYKYSLNNGQTPEYYGISTMELKAGQATPTGILKVTFDYFDHSAGDYFSVDSYSTTPDFIQPEFSGIKLRDVLDFRPRIDDAGVNFHSSGSSITNPIYTSSLISIDYSYYLPRRDAIVLSSAGDFSYVLGTSGYSLPAPSLPGNAIEIAEVISPAYADAEDVDVNVTAKRRYTMSDIHSLDQRLSNVEEYVALTLLEKQTSEMKIFDQFGLDRFKSGFLVDQFKDHSIGDFNNNEYRCSIDSNNLEVRPEFFSNAVTLVEPDGTSASVRVAKNYRVTGNMATLPYVDDVMINQPIASRGEFINPFQVADFRGQLQVIPNDDTWIDIRRLQTITNRIEGNFAQQAAQTGTWSSSSTQWTNDAWGARSLIQTSWSTQRTVQEVWNTQSLTTENLNFDIQFMRRKSTVITGVGMRPWTKLYSFFDDLPLGTAVKPADRIILTTHPADRFIGYIGSSTSTDNINARTSSIGNYDIYNRGEVIRTSSGKTAVVVAHELEYDKDSSANQSVVYVVNTSSAFVNGDVIVGQTSNLSGTVSAFEIGTNGENLETNSIGSFYGLITWEANTWATGNHTVKVSDVVSGTESESSQFLTTRYNAKGTLNTLQDTLTLRRDGVLSTSSWSSSTVLQTIQPNWGDGGGGDGGGGDGGDPLAQTFTIPTEFTDGAFVTKLDLYFHSKKADETLPVIAQIRETQNGYPARAVVPGGVCSLRADQITASTTSLIPTEFRFTHPLYLRRGVEYSIVIMTDSFDYKVWIARMADARTDNPALLVTEQPHTGSLFKSQNNSTWTAEQYEDLTFRLHKAKFDTARSGSIDFTNVNTDSAWLLGNPFKRVAGTSRVRVQHNSHGMVVGHYVTYTGSNVAIFNSTFQITEVTNSDSYIIDCGNVAVATALVGGNAVYASTNVKYDLLRIFADTFIPTSTGIDYTVRGATTTAKETVYRNVPSNQDIPLDSTRYVMSSVNENNILANAKSIDVRLNMYSFNEDLSPMLQMDGTSVVCMTNVINVPAITDNDVIDGETIHSGTGLSFSSVDNSISSSDLTRFVDGSIIDISGTTSNNLTDVLITKVDVSSGTHKVYVDKTLVTETGGSATVVQYDQYIAEHAVGSSQAKYVSQEVSLDSIASALHIVFDANIPPEAELEFWYRSDMRSSVAPLNKQTWEQVTLSYGKNSSLSEFLEQTYTLNNLSGFNTFQVKIVMKSSNTARVPRVKNLRVVALA